MPPDVQSEEVTVNDSTPTHALSRMLAPQSVALVGASTTPNVAGNDMALDPGMGNCGKAGQWVPVGVGQPTLLIGGLTIGGSAT